MIRRLWSGRVVWVPNKTGVETRIMGVGDKTDGVQNRNNLLIPVPWTTAKAIESLPKQPVFIFCGVGITGGWTNNCDFLRRENALAEGVLTVPLLETTTMLHRKTDQKMETVEAQNWSKPIALGPITSLTIAQNHDPRLGAEQQSCSSFLMVKTHIVGIALGAPFSQRAQYSPRMRRLKVPKLSMPPFSS
jgi:hypothetical protein